MYHMSVKRRCACTWGGLAIAKINNFETWLTLFQIIKSFFPKARLSEVKKFVFVYVAIFEVYNEALIK